MGLFDYLLRQIAGRAEVRADLVNVGARGGMHDLADLVRYLPPLDAFGEAASDAVLLILGRASAQELRAWRENAKSVDALRWHALTPEALRTCTDDATLVLSAVHPDERVRAVAREHLATRGDELAARMLEASTPAAAPE